MLAFPDVTVSSRKQISSNGTLDGLAAKADLHDASTTSRRGQALAIPGSLPEHSITTS